MKDLILREAALFSALSLANANLKILSSLNDGDPVVIFEGILRVYTQADLFCSHVLSELRKLPGDQAGDSATLAQRSSTYLSYYNVVRKMNSFSHAQQWRNDHNKPASNRRVTGE